MIHCESYRGYLRVYRKSALGGDFAFVGGGNTRGQWIPSGGLFGPYCAVVKDPSFVDLPAFSPPPLAPVVYRIAVGATVHGYWHRVRAGASQYPIVS